MKQKKSKRMKSRRKRRKINIKIKRIIMTIIRIMFSRFHNMIKIMKKTVIEFMTVR